MMKKTIDLRSRAHQNETVLEGFGGDNGRESYGVTSRCLLKNGKPFFPIMGECHYSRLPADSWEETIRKMKAGGVDIVATYIFWIHHEEVRGSFDWSGNRDLRGFLELCSRNGMKVWLRIGPWAHGECRNGGFPDWLMQSGIPLRQNDEAYFRLVRNFYREIYEQAKDYLFYRDGTVIGLQLENEYGHCGGLKGEEGRKHIRRLKELAVDIGFRVPYYTTTGWGNGIVVEGETLPVLGGYAEAPWAQHVNELGAVPAYLFSTPQCVTDIGSDLAGAEKAGFSYDVKKYPYLTAELGGGLQPTLHRRPIASADDTGALAFAYLGSGANLLGYYMYCGGTNPQGRYGTLQESKASGSPNDVPELSYDFQAPVGEYGILHASYGRLKALHMLLHDFGQQMASAPVFLPDDIPGDAEDLTSLRYTVRYGEKGGFLFLSNYQRRRRMPEKLADIEIRTPGGIYSFDNLRLSEGEYICYPFEQDFGGAKLALATAQPLCRISNGGHETYFFFAWAGERPVFQFEAENIAELKGSRAGEQNGRLEIRMGREEFGLPFQVKLRSGKTVEFVVLERAQALNAWKLRQDGKEYLLLTAMGVQQKGRELLLTGTEPEQTLYAYPFLPDAQVDSAHAEPCEPRGCFLAERLLFEQPTVRPEVSVLREEPREGGKRYELRIVRSKGGSAADDLLTLRFEGTRARFYVDGNFRADWFYLGPDWTLGLGRFGDLTGKSVRLDVEELRESDPVFLECRPEFRDGKACALRAASIKPEYRCRLLFD